MFIAIGYWFGLFFLVLLQAGRAQTIGIGVHDDLHLAWVDPHLFAPAVIIALAGEKPATGRASL